MDVVAATYPKERFKRTQASSKILLSVPGADGTSSKPQPDVFRCNHNPKTRDARRTAALANKNADSPVSMAAIVALQGGTKYTYIPQSHRIMRYLAAKDTNTWTDDVLEAITVTLPINSVTLFSQDIVHGGEECAEANVRGFCYIDRSDVERIHDTTYTPRGLFGDRGSILERTPPADSAASSSKDSSTLD